MLKFSQTEIQHLIKAWLAISIAFGILLTKGAGFNVFSNSFTYYFLISAFSVGIGFLVHELSHKYVAQKYNYFAEFRANNFMLGIAVLMSFLGFIIAAPGAVMIKAYYMTKERNGKISLAGPTASLGIAIIFFILLYLFPGNLLFYYGSWINIILAAFNLIPFPGFDGSKIFSWSKPVYITTAAITVLMLILINIL
ncbi:MAG: site-2 protease family protein [Nanoarchaeota archaeon]|nr:site-2 protease family protein [Nanoarchaeota archaeon]MBU1444888.1 site-2 protease family protein [Nanoarchaeota archaeon]MBU2406632.1 site-2 protease family protein [Nanoarchaeota archaeon]MBU2420207.1 site-2 protease family protein [Nanoarchaeota archaeon]MBU2475602.1 site-2 protease family protein [Nanoarchaeota archaeon]